MDILLPCIDNETIVVHTILVQLWLRPLFEHKVCPILRGQKLKASVWVILQIDLWCEDPTLCPRSWKTIDRVATRTFLSGDLGYPMICNTTLWICDSLEPWFIMHINQFVVWYARLVQVGYSWIDVWHHMNSFPSLMVLECYQCHENSPHLPIIWVFASNCIVPNSLSFLIV